MIWTGWNFQQNLSKLVQLLPKLYVEFYRRIKLPSSYVISFVPLKDVNWSEADSKVKDMKYSAPYHFCARWLCKSNLAWPFSHDTAVTQNIDFAWLFLSFLSNFQFGVTKNFGSHDQVWLNLLQFNSCVLCKIFIFQK